MWLLGDESVPDDCSFARFRKRNAEAIEDLLYQYVNLLEKQGETDHEVCFIDGTKWKAVQVDIPSHGEVRRKRA